MVWSSSLRCAIRSAFLFSGILPSGSFLLYTRKTVSKTLTANRKNFTGPWSGAIAGSPLTGAFEGIFYFLAGVGVRQRSRIAAVCAFSAYLLSALVLQRYTGSGFGIVRIIFLALLFANIRGNWLSARWASEQAAAPPVRLNETLGDKLVDQLPAWLWPKVRIAFYAGAGIEIALLLLSLFAPRPS